MKLDISSFEKAVGQLAKSVSYLNSELAKKDAGLREQFRAATVQTFEYTYELAVKMLRRQLERISPAPDSISKMDFMDLVRTAAQAGLLKNVAAWKRYREKRNITSHIYDAEEAEDVISVVGGFLKDMRSLLKELQKRNAGKKD
jgi:nucleotidyltransferase substrate binding protein (TIGR01987 family)